MRRLVHIGLLLLIVMVVRACGGVNQAEDRLSAATRWAAERTGLSGVKETLDTKVRPPIAAATRSLADAIYGGTARTMDQTEMAANGFGAWVGQQVTGAVVAVEAATRSVLMPNAKDEPQPADPSADKDRRPSRSR